MISRSELEGLIVDRLIDIRRAEARLNRSFQRLTHGRKNGRAELMFSLADLEARAGRLEMMLNALSDSYNLRRPAAA
jgi:hypothetical protein